MTTTPKPQDKVASTSKRANEPLPKDVELVLGASAGGAGIGSDMGAGLASFVGASVARPVIGAFVGAFDCTLDGASVDTPIGVTSCLSSCLLAAELVGTSGARGVSTVSAGVGAEDGTGVGILPGTATATTTSETVIAPPVVGKSPTALNLWMIVADKPDDCVEMEL